LVVEAVPFAELVVLASTAGLAATDVFCCEPPHAQTTPANRRETRYPPLTRSSIKADDSSKDTMLDDSIWRRTFIERLPAASCGTEH